MERKVLFSLGAALCISAAFADIIPLEREAWECVNPLGGDFTNGTYVSLHSAAQGFEIAKGVPASSNAIVDAAFTPGRIDGTGFKTAGVSLYNSDRSLATGFEICGEDGAWKPAKIVNVVESKDRNGKPKFDGPVSGKDLVVSAEDVAEPKKLRYLYSSPWFGSVYSDACLPLAAFHIGD